MRKKRKVRRKVKKVRGAAICKAGWKSVHHCESGSDDDAMETEESGYTGPEPIDCKASNVNQRREYENEVMEYRRRVVRRLNERAD